MMVCLINLYVQVMWILQPAAVLHCIQTSREQPPIWPYRAAWMITISLLILPAMASATHITGTLPCTRGPAVPGIAASARQRLTAWAISILQHHPAPVLY